LGQRDLRVEFTVPQLSLRQTSLENQQVDDSLDVDIIKAVSLPFATPLLLLPDTFMITPVKNRPVISVPRCVFERRVRWARGSGLFPYFRLSRFVVLVH
jgi:hypothetical protein